MSLGVLTYGESALKILSFASFVSSTDVARTYLCGCNLRTLGDSTFSIWSISFDRGDRIQCLHWTMSSELPAWKYLRSMPASGPGENISSGNPYSASKMSLQTASKSKSVSLARSKVSMVPPLIESSRLCDTSGDLRGLFATLSASIVAPRGEMCRRQTGAPPVPASRHSSQPLTSSRVVPDLVAEPGVSITLSRPWAAAVSAQVSDAECLDRLTSPCLGVQPSLRWPALGTVTDVCPVHVGLVTRGRALVDRARLGELVRAWRLTLLRKGSRRRGLRG